MNDFTVKKSEIVTICVVINGKPLHKIKVNTKWWVDTGGDMMFKKKYGGRPFLNKNHIFVCSHRLILTHLTRHFMKCESEKIIFWLLSIILNKIGSIDINISYQN